ncbi:MAG: ATP-binding protein [Thermoanaerobaculia bacterium]
MRHDDGDGSAEWPQWAPRTEVGRWRSGIAGRCDLERLKRAVESMEDGLFILDRDGTITFANQAARRLLDGLDAGQHHVDPAACCRRRCGRTVSCRRCLANPAQLGQPAVFSLGERVYEIHATRLGDSGELHEEQVFVSRDVTERKRLEELEAHRECLSVVGEVAAVLAHEMSNPLAAISLFSQMLLDELQATPPLRSYVEVIHRNTLGCNRTLRSILDMAAAAPATAVEFEAPDLVGEVVELLQPVARHNRVALEVEAAEDRGHLYADELSLRRALINLVINGIQATAGRVDGAVKIAIFERDDEVVIQVRDNGPGIPVEVQGRIFELFFTTKPPGQGTGLGLPSARQVAEAHGGRLVLATSSGAGSTFELALPRSLAAGEDLAPDGTARGGMVA